MGHHIVNLKVSGNSNKKTLILLNPFAKSGKLFFSIFDKKKLLKETFGEVEIFAFTKDNDFSKLNFKLKNGVYEKIISVGGDGTNNYILNNLIIPLDLKIPFGNLPIGTGSDWARALKIPKKIKEAVEWIKNAKEVECDIGLVEYNINGREEKKYFLNIASFGFSGKVAAIVNKWTFKGKTSYFWAALILIFSYIAPQIKIFSGEEKLFEGRAYLSAFANGQIFGGGMKISPLSKINDGLFELIIVKNTSTFNFLKGLFLVLKGKHLNHNALILKKGKEFKISSNKILDFELDGEDGKCDFAKISCKEKKIPVLLNPENAPIIAKS